MIIRSSRFMQVGLGSPLFVIRWQRLKRSAESGSMFIGCAGRTRVAYITWAVVP